MLWRTRGTFVHAVILSFRTVRIINTHKMNQYFRKYFWIIYLHDLFQQLSPQIDYMFHEVAIHSVCVEFTNFIFTECATVLATVKSRVKPLFLIAKNHHFFCHIGPLTLCIVTIKVTPLHRDFLLFYPFPLFLV